MKYGLTLRRYTMPITHDIDTAYDIIRNKYDTIIFFKTREQVIDVGMRYKNMGIKVMGGIYDDDNKPLIIEEQEDTPFFTIKK